MPGKFETTVGLTRVMLPFLPLVSFAAVAMGMLNAQRRFAVPALAPAVFNVVAIVWAGGLWSLGFGCRPGGAGLGGGHARSAGVAQFLDAGAAACGRRASGFRPEWAPGDPSLRAIAGADGARHRRAWPRCR